LSQNNSKKTQKLKKNIGSKVSLRLGGRKGTKKWKQLRRQLTAQVV
jgi:hypothetical protein